MKQILLTLMLFTAIIRSDEYFLLPDHSSDALFALKKRINNADENIILITSSTLDKSLLNALQKALKRTVRLETITPSEQLAGTLSLYHNSRVQLLRSSSLHEFHFSLLLVDDAIVCSSALDFDRAVMRQNTAVLHCTDSKEEITFYHYIYKQLKSRSDKYFKK